MKHNLHHSSLFTKQSTSSLCLHFIVYGLALAVPVCAQNKESGQLLQQIPYPVIGATSVLVNQTIENQLNEFSSSEADIKVIQNSSSEPRYLAIGGSLTAGVRNGGLYRQGQLTSYPNLIAKRMGLKNFQQPLFDNSQQGNGSGYIQVVQEGNPIKYNNVVNALAITEQNPLTFTSYSGQVDNLGMPGLGILGATVDEQWRIDENLAFSIPYEPSYRAYFRRLLPTDNRQWTTSYLNYLAGQSADICTIELGLDDAIWFASQGGYRLDGLMAQLGVYSSNPIKILASQFSKSKSKPILSTIPDVLSLPYFKQYQVSVLKKNFEKIYATQDDRYDYLNKDPSFVGQLKDSDILLPTSNIVGLFEGTSSVGLTAENPLTSLDVLNALEQEKLGRVDELNEMIVNEADKLNVPFLDLRAIYKNIIDGTFTTDDGLIVDPSFPDGNFFSADGLTPTAFGQAVLANEWIKKINEAYSTKIPLVPTKAITSKF